MAKDSVDKNQTNERAHSGAGHHDAPEWSKRKSIAILLISTVVFSLLAELLVDSVDEVIASLRLDPKFLGLTVFAIVPSFTEFMNAIMFASYGNVALSLEIGSAYLIQVALIQIPCLVAFSAFYAHLYGIPDTLEKSFTLIFPKWDCFTVFFGVFLLSYTYIEGKSNYFKGSILTLSYLVMLMSFYFAPI
jgi:Ca2+:H+ antiporter